MRTISEVPGNTQRLDGGAMFGNAPKPLWERWIAADERNRIPLACRAMLVDDGGRLILCEAGIGVFFDPKLRDRFGVEEEEHVLLESLRALGVRPDDVDVVVLSHLHFDHAGGLLSAFAPGRDPELVFGKARFVVGYGAWERAKNPHARDKASFIPDLNRLLEESGRLEIVHGPTSQTLGDGYRFHLSEGHTPGLLLVEVPSDDGPIVFAGDLVPGRAWMHLPITMGYDRFPERLIEEKGALLRELAARNGRLFFTHDPLVAMAAVAQDERGKFGPGAEWPHPRRLPV
jgi:glyoxylase-like metal-dependent hydrolase (beta-lactamase superfamily II)